MLINCPVLKILKIGSQKLRVCLFHVVFWRAIEPLPAFPYAYVLYITVINTLVSILHILVLTRWRWPNWRPRSGSDRWCGFRKSDQNACHWILLLSASLVEVAIATLRHDVVTLGHLVADIHTLQTFHVDECRHAEPPAPRLLTCGTRLNVVCLNIDDQRRFTCGQNASSWTKFRARTYLSRMIEWNEFCCHWHGLLTRLFLRFLRLLRLLRLGWRYHDEYHLVWLFAFFAFFPDDASSTSDVEEITFMHPLAQAGASIPGVHVECA